MINRIKTLSHVVCWEGAYSLGGHKRILPISVPLLKKKMKIFTKRNFIHVFKKWRAIVDNKINMAETLELYLNGGKHCEKRKKFWSPAFSPLPTTFSKDFSGRVVKIRGCVARG